MEGNVVMTLIIAFIAAAIMLSLGVAILGNTATGFDCSSLDGYNSTKSSATGWGLTCIEIQESQRDSFNLLIIILIVIAAVAILVVVRMLY